MIQRILIFGALAAAAAMAQQPAPEKTALQQRLAAVKQSIATNQAQLRAYSWTETTEISLKGEVKKREQKDCRYGPDGKVVKTAIGDAASPAKKRGLRGKIIENKVDELKEYMDRVGSLVRRYIPPDAQTMQASFQAGKASIAMGSLVFNDYAKPGDKVTITFDMATKKIQTFAIATYLDEPKDVVTLNANFSSLADGTNFIEGTVLDVTAKEIQIKTTNFGHRKAGG